MATQIGGPRSFHKKFKFRVFVAGLSGTGAFKSCSEIGVELAVVSHSEGGTLIPNKSPGRATVADITLDRGVTDNEDLFNWFKDVVDLSIGDPTWGDGAGVGLPDDLYKRDVSIVQYDRNGDELKRWTLHGAWPRKYVGGAWDNEADETTMEQVILAYDYPTYEVIRS